MTSCHRSRPAMAARKLAVELHEPHLAGFSPWQPVVDGAEETETEEEL